MMGLDQRNVSPNNAPLIGVPMRAPKADMKYPTPKRILRLHYQRREESARIIMYPPYFIGVNCEGGSTRCPECHDCRIDQER